MKARKMFAVRSGSSGHVVLYSGDHRTSHEVDYIATQCYATWRKYTGIPLRKGEQTWVRLPGRKLKR